MRWLPAILLSSWLAAAVPAPAAPAPAPGWKTLRPGLEYRAAPLGAGPFPAMHQVRVDPARLRLGLAVATDHGSPALSVSALRQAAQALVAVNASYFDRDWKPLGYLREGDRLLVPGVATGAAFTGVLVVRPDGARILHRGSFQPGRARLALQAGPRLVAGGVRVEGLGGPARRRTGVALDRRGRYVLFATDPMGDLTLAACADHLLRPPARGGVEPADALNLDGGSSTGFSLAVGKVKVDSPALTAVPVALTVVPR